LYYIEYIIINTIIVKISATFVSITFDILFICFSYYTYILSICSRISFVEISSKKKVDK